MKNNKIKKIIIFTSLFFFIAWSIFLVFVDMTQLVKNIGISNVYLLLLIVAITSGTSALTTTSFYAVYLSYINAGFDPWILGVIGGIGLSVGDTIFFYVAQKTQQTLNQKKGQVYTKIYDVVGKLPEWGVCFFAFMYSAFVPLPNDMLMITLGALQFKYRRVIVFVIIGNIVLLSLIAHGVSYLMI